MAWGTSSGEHFLASNPATLVQGNVFDTGGMVYNVRGSAYGGKGDGVANDAATHKLAFDAASAAGGGVVYTPPANVGASYRFVGTAFANMNNHQQFAGVQIDSKTTWQGAGRASAISTDAIPGSVHGGVQYFAVAVNKHPTTGDSYINIYDMAFPLPAPTETGTGMDAWDSVLDFQGVAHARVRGCYIMNGTIGFYPIIGDGNQPNALTNKTGDDCSVSDSVIESMTGSFTFFQTTNGKFYSNRIFKVWDDPILLGSAGSGHRLFFNSIDGTPVTNNKGAASGCMYFLNDGGVAQIPDSMADIIAFGNAVFNLANLNAGARAGYTFVGSSRDLKVIGGSSYGNQHGIFADWESGITVKNMTWRDLAIFKNVVDGIKVTVGQISTLVEELRVHECDIYNNGTYAFDIYANGVLRMDLQGNNCYDDQAVATQTVSLHLAEDVSGMLQIRSRGNRYLNTTALSTYAGGAGATSSFKDDLGLTPANNLAAPGIPASGTVFANPFPYDCLVLIAAGTLTAIGLGGCPTPVNRGFATTTTGGTLAPGTYYYRVTAVNRYGETLASPETSLVVPGGTSTNTVRVIWGAVPGASYYNVYGRSTGAELKMATGVLSNSWVDTGAVTPSGALPGGDTTGNTATGITAAAAAGSVHSLTVPHDGAIKLTKSVDPTWTWFGIN